jgi:hypothetical protein
MGSEEEVPINQQTILSLLHSSRGNQYYLLTRRQLVNKWYFLLDYTKSTNNED